MMFKEKRRVLCELLWQTKTKIPQEKIDFLITNLNLQERYNASQIIKIRSKLLNAFWPHYYLKWQAASRTREKFESKFKDYLDEDFVIHLQSYQSNQGNQEDLSEEIFADELNVSEPPRLVDTENKGVQCINFGGRPKVPYKNASERTKRKRSNTLSEEYCTFQLGSALKRRIIYNVGDNGLDSDDMKSYMQMSQVLAMYLDCKFTAGKYNKFKKHNELITSSDSYPSYKKLEIAKRESYPSEINVDEVGANAPLFSLLENTLKKLILLKNKEEWAYLSTQHLILEGKIGMDGASGQRETRQAWSTDKKKRKLEWIQNLMMMMMRVTMKLWLLKCQMILL